MHAHRGLNAFTVNRSILNHFMAPIWLFAKREKHIMRKIRKNLNHHKRNNLITQRCQNNRKLKSNKRIQDLLRGKYLKDQSLAKISGLFKGDKFRL